MKPHGTHITEQIADELFIGCRGEIRNEQRRPGSELHFNGVVVDHLLVACLRNKRFVPRLELDDGNLRIAVLAMEHFDRPNGAALHHVR